MEKNLALAVPSSATSVTPSPAPPSPASNTMAMQNDAADLRLVIEEDQASGLFIYKTVDRRTGDVVQQFPRDEVIRMHEAADYLPGALIKARA
jgi:flagellar protein FlaG